MQDNSIRLENSKMIYSGPNSIIYYDENTNYQNPILIKVLKEEYPNFQQIKQFYNEYDISQELINIPGIRTVYQKTKIGDRNALVMEYIPGNTIYELWKESNDLKDFLELAIDITNVLGHLHKHHIIHKDINSKNIIVNSANKAIYIIDLGISSKIDTKVQSLGNPENLEGTLPYISPEQTGRMNRVVDYRTDFYSLGITFYEMLTGNLPFFSDDPMELVHSHIAVNPVPVHERKPSVPGIVSDIIHKLMEKNAEDRYQTTDGLISDLIRCLREFEDTGGITPFDLGMQDFSPRFIIPQKLYGIDEEKILLLNAFSRVADGDTECVMVTGHSGVGKSSLVHEIHKPITEHRGYFISGKFEQYGQTLPYSAIIQAFSQLINLFLTEDDNFTTSIKEQIMSRVGSNGRVLIDLIPNLELILGPQPVVPQLGTIEAMNRFIMVCKNFLIAVCTPIHPITLFLDDLQWIDHASLHLIKKLLTDDEIRSFLIIGAYRDNEVDSSHPLTQTLNEMKGAGAKISTITLYDLSQESVTSLIADTLHSSSKLVFDLSELIYEKTSGNAFFVHQFLKYLYAQGLLINEEEGHRWNYDVNTIKKESITENVVELLIGKIEKLSEDEKMILRLASCIGNHFTLQTISAITDHPPSEIYRRLTTSLQEGLIISIDENIPLVVHGDRTDTITSELAFLHDRVQQAAYTLIPENEKAHLHLKIGRSLLSTNKSQIESQIFEITGHFNKCLHLLSDKSEQEKIIELNLKAGIKAKYATAFVNARDFLKTGMNLLPEESWEQMHQITFNLFVNRAECEYTLGEFEISKQLLDEALLNAKMIEEKLIIAVQMINQSSWEGRFLDSVHIGIQAFREYEISLPALEDDAEIDEYVKTQIQWFSDNWHETPVSDLISLPENTESTYHLLTRILGNLIDAAVIEYPFYLPVLTFTSVNLSIHHGITLDSSYGFICHAMILSVSTNDFAIVDEFTQVGLALAERIPDNKVRCKVMNLFSFVGYVKTHLADIPAYGEQGYYFGLDGGDYVYAGYSLANGHRMFISAGVPLPECFEKGELYLTLIKKINQKFTYDSMIVNIAPFIRELTGKTMQPEAYNPEIIADIVHTSKNNFIIAITKCYLSMAMYILERDEEALLLASEDILPFLEIIVLRVEFRYISSLLYLRNISLYDGPKREQILSTVYDYLSFINQLAQSAPFNFLSHVRLIEAELARIQERPFDAMKLYNQAINLASEQNLIHYEAIANECAGKFWLGIGMSDIAKLYLRKSVYCYDLWGASKKVEMMEATYPDIYDIKTLAPFHTIHNTTGSSSGSHKNIPGILDLSTILKASQTLSEEIHLSTLLEKMMRFVIENAGATKGALLTLEDGTLLVQATGETKPDSIKTMLAIPIREYAEIPHSILNFTHRSRNLVILHNVLDDEMYAKDPYIIRARPKSVLCIPIENQGKLSGVLYLENGLISGAFTEDRVELLRILSTQAAVSLENALLYKTLEDKIQERTSDLEQALQKVREQHERLLTTQSQLVESEKMAGLGTIVAGVAHEINNPANYLYVSSKTLEKDITSFHTEILGLIDESDIEITKYLDNRFNTFHRSLKNINDGSNRIKTIVQDLRSVSRFNETVMEEIRIKEALESTIRIVEAKYKSDVIFITKFEADPIISGYPAQLSQVFLNIMVNSCQAIITRMKDTGDLVKGRLVISLQDTGEAIKVSFQDNGCGMTEETKIKIFEPFFTTKPVGEGTGLGMYLSYGIIQKHNGDIEIDSHVGSGTTFTIVLPYGNRS